MAIRDLDEDVEYVCLRCGKVSTLLELMRMGAARGLVCPNCAGRIFVKPRKPAPHGVVRRVYAD